MNDMARIRYAFRSLAQGPDVELVVSALAGAGDRREYRDLLAAAPAGAQLAAGPEAGGTGPAHVARRIQETAAARANDSGGQDYIFSYPVFRALEKNSQALAGLAGVPPARRESVVREADCPGRLRCRLRASISRRSACGR